MKTQIGSPEEDGQPAPGGLETVRRFVNTADLEDQTDLLETPQGLHQWLVERNLIRPRDVVSEADWRQTVELREALRDVLEGHTEGQVAATASRRFDTATSRVPVRLRVDETGWVRLEPASGGVVGALGQILAWSHEGMEDGSWQRLKACSDEGCRFAFYDHSKNHSGKWCDMSTCGNRAKVAAFRVRQAENKKPGSRARRA